MNSKRILALLSFINKEDLVVDVGCDHAYLSKNLEKRNQKSIACDIVKEIIEERKKENSKLIKYYVSDGLKDIDEEFSYPVISGMGTSSILKILKLSKLNFDKCLISSNNDNKTLREEMNKLGFRVQNEIVIKQKNKYYNIIMFEKGKYNYTKEELYLGINHLDKKLYNEKNKYLYKKYCKLINSVPKDKQDNLNEKLSCLKKVLNLN